MIATKALCWFLLMMINIPMLLFAAMGSLFVNLFNMPMDIWENVNEFFNSKE